MFNENATIRTKTIENDAFTEMLKETADYFKGQGVALVKDFQEIVTEGTLFNEYVSRLSEGLSADDSAQLEAMFENQRMALIKESSIGDIAPIAGLSMPLLRKTWVKCTLKNAIVTETATKPQFTVAYMKPYMILADGTKLDPTKELRGATPTAFGNLPAITTDFHNVGSSVNLITSTLINGVAASKMNGDALNTVLFIQKVKMEVPADSGTVVVEVPVSIKVGISGEIYADVTAKSAHALPANQVVVTDKLFGKVDFSTGDATVVSASGKVKSVQYKGNLTQEANTRTDRISFEISKTEINIPAASHIEAALPMEFIQDTMAIYNIDATAEVTNLLSETVSHKLDQEIALFYEQSDINAGSPYQATFSAKPSAGFNGTPTEWRSELKTMITHWCVRLREDLQIEQGYFILIANPLDAMLLEGVTWSVKNQVDTVGGVMANYDMGVLTGTQQIRVISSSRVAKGKMRVLFFPTTNVQKSYTYYPYSYILSTNLRSGAVGTANLPTIVVSKRHILHEFAPMQFTITITDNDGVIPAKYN